MRIGIYSIVISVLLLGCKNELQDDPVIVADVDNEFVVDMQETFTPMERPLQFKLQSLLNQSCQNYSIEFDLKVYDNRIILKMQELIPPAQGECELGNAPAISIAEAGVMAKGYFDLQINIQNDVINRGRLIVDNTSYRIDLESNIGITIPELVLNKIPKQTIFGCISYNNEGMKVPANTLLKVMQEQTNTQLLPDGYYGYFKVKGNEIFASSKRTSDGSVHYFQANYTDLATIKQTIQQYRSQYTDQLKLSFFTTEGDVL